MLRLLLLLAITSHAYAQSPFVPQNSTPAPNPAPIQNQSISDYLHPGWSGKYTYALGYSTTLTNTSTFIFDYYPNLERSYSTYLGFSKAVSGYSQTTTNNGTTQTITNSGSKTGATLTLAESFNRKIFRNDWTNIRIGLMVGLNYFTDAEYDVGTRSINLNTGVNTDTGYGKSKVEREIQYFTGPVLSTALNIRWLPMITVGMDGGLLFFTESQQKTKTKSMTGATASSSTAKTEPGYAATMSGNGLFNLFGNFAIRYVWN